MKSYSSSNLVSHIRQREYGLNNRPKILSSIFHTGSHGLASSSSSVSFFSSRYAKALSNRRPRNTSNFPASRKRTVSENDENRRDSYGYEKATKRLCRSSEWIFGDSQLTLFKSISTIDNRPSLIDNSKHSYLLSKSDQFLSTHSRRYSSDKQQALDTLNNLVLSQ